MEPNKIFVGGLSWDTTKEGLKHYFEKFGEVVDSVIMVDSATKKPRGFGFVTFLKDESVMACLGSTPHVIDGKTVDPKPATMKNADSQQGVLGYDTQQHQGQKAGKKIFVGGLPNEVNDDSVKEFFSQFGEVSEVDLKYDKETGRMRGFGFVGFVSEDVVEKVVQIHYHQINGKTVEAKKAEPRNAGGGGGGGGGVSKKPQQQTAAANPGYYAANYGGYPYFPPQAGHTPPQTQQQQQYSGYYNPATAAAEYYQVYAQQAAAAQQQAGLGQQQMSSYGTGYNQRAAFNTAESAYTNRHSSSGGGYGYDSYGDGGQSASAAATAAGYNPRGQQQSQRSFGY